MNNKIINQSPILPPATLGLLGGGQLGRYFSIAATLAGYKVVVLDPDPLCPAANMANHHLCMPYSLEAAHKLIEMNCQAITTEFEHIPLEMLEYLSAYSMVRPHPKCIQIAQNRLLEKAFFQELNLPTAPYQAIKSEEDCHACSIHALCPGILKTAENGYDGKGQINVENQTGLLSAWNALGKVPCVLEKKIVLEKEVSIIVARSAQGDIASYPVAENTHRGGILDSSLVPARIPTELIQQIITSAYCIVDKLNYVGVMAVEFFISKQQLLLNEMAPRPHNSGHYTLDATHASQFDQQLRAVCGLPLLSTEAYVPSALMMNILGDSWYSIETKKCSSEPNWNSVLCNTHAHLHLYGKTPPRCGRKMGHITLTGNESDIIQQANELRRTWSNPIRSSIGSLPPIE